MNVNIPLGAVTCIVTRAGMIYDPYIYVTVPVLGIPADKQGGGVMAAAEIRAKNATDYRIYHDGIIDMKSTDYEITHSLTTADPPGVPKHGHHSVEPFHGEDVHYWKLNEVPLNVGDMCIGFFLDGDSKNLAITHIVGKVPIGGEVVYDK